MKYLAIKTAVTAAALIVAAAAPAPAADSGYCLQKMGRVSVEKLVESLPWKTGESGRINGLNGDKTVDVLFMGRAVDENRRSRFFLFYEPSTGFLHVFPSGTVSLPETEPIFKPHRQKGDTCFQEGCFGALESMKLRGWMAPVSRELNDAGRRRQIFNRLSAVAEDQNDNSPGYRRQMENFREQFGKWKIPFKVVSHTNPKAVSILMDHLEGGGVALMGYRVDFKKGPLNKVNWDKTGGSFDKSQKAFTRPSALPEPGPGHVVLAVSLFRDDSGAVKVLIADSEIGFYQIFSEEDLRNATASKMDSFILLGERSGSRQKR